MFASLYPLYPLQGRPPLPHRPLPLLLPLVSSSCRSLASEPRSLHFVLHLFAGGFLGQHGQREFDLGAYRVSGGCKREPFFHSLLPRVV